MSRRGLRAAPFTRGRQAGPVLEVRAAGEGPPGVGGGGCDWRGLQGGVCADSVCFFIFLDLIPGDTGAYSL